MTFVFDAKYLSYAGAPTGTTSDDGVNITWMPGQVIGHIQTANFPTGFTPTFYLSSGGGNDVMGRTMEYNIATGTNVFDTQPSAGNVAAVHIDPTTGVMTLVDPFTMIHSANGNFLFTIEAHDLATNQFISQVPVLIQINTPGSVGDVLVVGDAVAPPATTIPAETGQPDTSLQASLTAGVNDILFGRGGNDFIFLDPTENDTVLGGHGDDTIGMVGTSFKFIDGGQNANDHDILAIGGAVGLQDYDFRGTNNIVNIEEIKLTDTGSGGPTLRLNLADVFSMTDDQSHGTGPVLPPHSLKVVDSTAGYVSDVYVGITGWTLGPSTSGGVTVGNTIGPGSGSVTINASFNSQTVTLVIDTGSAGNGVNVHIVN